jgi:bacillithiol biosynthesis cysteine-adding enzyme BshC
MGSSAFDASGSSPYRPAPASMLGDATLLYRDFLYARDRLASYLGPAFDDDASIVQLAARLRSCEYQRDVLARALRDLANETGAPNAARAQLESLRRPDSLVVFTGQQPGLYTGPLYTLYKALTVERWAADLARGLGVRVIPCFWLGSDDHDIAEVDHVQLPVAGRLETLRYVPAHGPNGAPLGRIALDAGIESVTDRLAACLPASSRATTVVDCIRQCYAAGVSLPGAFARMWYRMFPNSALLFVSPDHPLLRQLAAPLLARSVAGTAELFSAYEEASHRLEAEGYPRQVMRTPAQTFLFQQRGARHAIRRVAGSGFEWQGAQPVSADELQKLCIEHPDDFSPNVLLRPVVQNSLFPTLGVVLGPAEVAYYAQIGGLHDYFGVPRPAVLPRTSVTLVERNMLPHLQSYGVELEGLRNDVDREVARALGASFPQDLDAELQAAAQAIGAAFEAVGKRLDTLDPMLVRTAQAAAVRARRQIEIVAAKAHASHRRRQQQAQVQIRAAGLYLFPGGALQERCFNIVYYWARHGQEFLDELHQGWPIRQRGPLLREIATV